MGWDMHWDHKEDGQNDTSNHNYSFSQQYTEEPASLGAYDDADDEVAQETLEDQQRREEALFSTAARLNGQHIHPAIANLKQKDCVPARSATWDVLTNSKHKTGGSNKGKQKAAQDGYRQSTQSERSQEKGDWDGLFRTVAKKKLLESPARTPTASRDPSPSNAFKKHGRSISADFDDM